MYHLESANEVLPRRGEIPSTHCCRDGALEQRINKRRYSAAFGEDNKSPEEQQDEDNRE